MITATVSLNVPDLPENDIWFANAQAWNNYWRNITATIEIDTLASTNLYVPFAFNENIQDVEIYVDGVPFYFITKEKFDSLKNKVANLDTNYQQLRSALQDAGIIDNAQ